MGDRRDPRVARVSDPRLHAVKPVPTDRLSSSRTRPNEPRSNDRHADRHADRHSRDRRSGGNSSHEMHSSGQSDFSDSMPSRYSPPPSLKPYTIPRRAGQKILFKPTSLDSREGTFAIDTIKNSLWNPETIMFEFTKIETVNNDRLEAEYITKRKELKEQGRTSSEISDCFGFLHMPSKDGLKDVCQNGLNRKRQHHLPPLAGCSIGNKNYGVYICRCADAITRKIPSLQYGNESIMLICKIMKGRVKTINDSPDQGDGELEPTPDFDCHVSRRFQRGKKMSSDHIFDAAQIYLYEINLDNFSVDDDTAIFTKRPRQCLPFAVVYFKAKQNLPPVIDPLKLPVKEPTLAVPSVVNSVGKTNVEVNVGEQTYDECLKNLRYVWKGQYFMKNKFVSMIQIGIFSKKDLFFPIETPNLTIQQKISWERLSKILPGKIYRKPPCKTLQPETEVVNIKFLHGEIHAVDQTTENIVQKLHNSWLKSNMAGMCTLSSGYKLYILPSSVFTDKLGLTDLCYPAILHCIFMKESTEITSMKGTWYDKFLLRQQFSLHSRLCENEDLKDGNVDVNTCDQSKYAYSIAERQTIARYIAQIKRSQGKRGKPVDINKRPAQSTFIPSSSGTAICATNNPPSAQMLIGMPVNIHPQHVVASHGMSYVSCSTNNLLTSVPTHVPVTQVVSSTLISPSSSDSLSGTEQCPDEQQPAIDFCLSFKREGSARTERVKLFPTETRMAPAPPICNDRVALTYSLPAGDVPPPPPPPRIPVDVMDAPISSAPVVVPTDMIAPNEDVDKEYERLKIPAKESGNTSDSSQDSEDNLVINLDDNAEDNESNDTPPSDDKLLDEPDDLRTVEGDSHTCGDNSKIVESSEVVTSLHSTPVKSKGNEVMFEKSSQNLLSQITSTLAPLAAPPTVSLSKSSPPKACMSSDKPFSFSNIAIPSSPAKSKPSPLRLPLTKPAFSLALEETSITKTSNALAYAIDVPEGFSSNEKSLDEETNYDNLTMDEGSEDSQGAVSISSNHNEVDMECEEVTEISKELPRPPPLPPISEKKNPPAKCSSPSLTQLTFEKEKILMQLSLLKSQAEERRKQGIKPPAPPPPKETTPKYDSDSESGSESQGSEVIPFLGDDDGDRSEDDVLSDTTRRSSEEDLGADAVEVIDKRVKAEGLNIEKAEMAILSIGSQYYDQVSPAVSDPPSLKVSPIPPLPPTDKDKSPPPPPPPERPVLAVQPVTTTSSSPVSAISAPSVTVATITTVKTSCVTVSSTCTAKPSCATTIDSTAQKIPFLSDDPCDSVSATSSSTTGCLSSKPQELSVPPYRPPITASVHTAHTLPQVASTRSPAVASMSYSLPATTESPISCLPSLTVGSSRPPTLPLVADSIKTSVALATSLSNRGHSPTPKRPIMEVSPVVRSITAPWLLTSVSHPHQSIRPLMSPGNIPDNTFRPIDHRSLAKPPYHPPYNSFHGKGDYGVNREQADAMFYCRDPVQDRNLEGAQRGQDVSVSVAVKNKLGIPRAYRRSSSPHCSSSSRPRTPEDNSSHRSHRRSPSPSTDWDHRAHRHRDSRRRSRSRSPYSRTKYHHSGSPPPSKRSRDTSPRYAHDDGEWESNILRKVYGSDIDVYKDDKPGRSGERLERVSRLDRRAERPDHPDRPIRSDKSPSHSPSGLYSRNNPNESLDEYLNRNNNPNSKIYRPNIYDGDNRRPRHNLHASAERSSSLPIPPDNNLPSGSIKERIITRTGEEKAGTNLLKKDFRGIDVSLGKISQKSGSKITGCDKNLSDSVDTSSTISYLSSPNSATSHSPETKRRKRFRKKRRAMRKQNSKQCNERVGRRESSGSSSNEEESGSDSQIKKRAKDNGWDEWLNTPLALEEVESGSSNNESEKKETKDEYTIISGNIPPSTLQQPSMFDRSVAMMLPHIDENANRVKRFNLIDRGLIDRGLIH